jgi:hypothetical protein
MFGIRNYGGRLLLMCIVILEYLARGIICCML